MNTLFLMTSCDINSICIYVTIVVLGCVVLNVFRSIAIAWLEHRDCKKNDENPVMKTPEEVEYKHELERQDRVRGLMREICELTKDWDSNKENDGQYNDSEANNLFELYKKIDGHIKLKDVSKKNEK